MLKVTSRSLLVLNGWKAHSTKLSSIEATSNRARASISGAIVDSTPSLDASKEQATTNQTAPINNNLLQLQSDPPVTDEPRVTHRVAARIATRPTTESTATRVDHTQHRALRGQHTEGLRRTKLPRLVQGTSQLKTYLTTASAAFSMVSKEGTSEIEFVAAFLKGMREEKQRDALVRELQKAHPCRMSSGDTVEIICQWEDVVEALKWASLVESEGKEERPAKRRKKMLIPTEMIDNGLMN